MLAYVGGPFMGLGQAHSYMSMSSPQHLSMGFEPLCSNVMWYELMGFFYRLSPLENLPFFTGYVDDVAEIN